MGKGIVSIITVVFNNVNTIHQCIDSVLLQDYCDIEYIVIDGGSTDGTLEVLQEYGDDIDILVSEPDDGLYDAMNKGLKLATGDYIAFLNSDDFYLQGAISASMNNIVDNDLDLSYAGFIYMRDDGYAVLADEGRSWDESMLIQGIPGGHETIFAHRKCYDELGGFDTSLKVAADYNWVMSAFDAGFKAMPLKKNILVMRMGGASFSEENERNENYYLLEKQFGSLPSTLIDDLYSLKFYKNWHGSDISQEKINELLKDSYYRSERYRKSLFLTLNNLRNGIKGKILPMEKKDKAKKRIAVFVSFLTNVTGGAERIAIEQANELHRRGHAVTVVCCHGLAGGAYYSLDEDIPYIDLAIHPYNKEYYEEGKNLVLRFNDIYARKFDDLNYIPIEKDFQEWLDQGNLWRIQVINGFLKKHDFDCVISHMPSSYPYVLFSESPKTNTVHIAALHNAPSFKFYSPLYPANSDMERYLRLVALEKATAISVIFDGFVKQMPIEYRKKTIVLPNFISIDTNEICDLSVEKKVILSVGRLSEQKDHRTLLSAFNEVKKKYPDWSLHIYGEGPLKNDLATYTETLGLNPENIFLGVRRNIEEVYKTADIYVIPSIFEGFGLTLVEAMANGLPVIGFSDCEGVNKIIKNKKNGFLVSRIDDVQSLANAISNLIGDAIKRREYGKESIKLSKQYRVKNNVDILEKKVLDKITGSSGPTKRYENIDIKVCQVLTYVQGGAGIAAVRLHEGLRRKAIDSKVVGLTAKDCPSFHRVDLEKDQISMFELMQNLVSDDNMKGEGTAFSTSYAGLSNDQLELIKGFDVINLHWIQRILSNEAIADLSNIGKPIVWTMHDMNPFTGGCHYDHGCGRYKTGCFDCPQLINTYNEYPAKILAAKERYWSKNIIVVTPSRWLAKCARNSKVFKDNQIEVIPNSLDTDVFVPTEKALAKSRFNIPLSKPTLLFSCHSHGERRKGFNELVETSKILKNKGLDFHILTFGHESKELSSLGFSYSSLGHIDDPSTLALGYSAADITVLPSLEDNLPNIILESISCGTPVAAFNSGGIGDAVIDGVTGSLAERGSCNDLANSIIKLCDSDLSSSCREYSEKEFSLHVQADRYLKLYKNVVSQNEWYKNNERSPMVFPEMQKCMINMVHGILNEEKSIKAVQINNFSYKRCRNSVDLNLILENSRVPVSSEKRNEIVAIRRSGLFYNNYYLEQFIRNPEIDPLIDYVLNHPTKAPNPLFDGEWYLQRYPEVKEAGYNPLYHFIMFYHENYDPCPDFSTIGYVHSHPEVKDNNMNPLLHYLKFGIYMQNDYLLGKER